MNSLNSIAMKALKERKIELQLKAYFKKMDTSFGEDYCSCILSSDIRPSESLKMFTSSFSDITDTDIVLALIKGAILSKDINYANEMIKDFVSNGDMEDVMNLVYGNLSIRKMLTRNFVHLSYSSNSHYYLRKEDNDNTIGNLLTILYFQESIPILNEKKKKMI